MTTRAGRSDPAECHEFLSILAKFSPICVFQNALWRRDNSLISEKALVDEDDVKPIHNTNDLNSLRSKL